MNITFVETRNNVDNPDNLCLCASSPECQADLSTRQIPVFLKPQSFSTTRTSRISVPVMTSVSIVHKFGFQRMMS